MERGLRTAAVLGAGTMGAGIAALLAEKGIKTTLLDLVPSELTEAEREAGWDLDQPSVRNRLASEAIRRLLASRDPVLSEESAGRITTGNIEDHLEWISDADWIVEAVVEDLAIKRALLARIEPLRRTDAIISTNTSGLSLRRIADGRSNGLARHFLGTHFFNPPHRMRLLEVIPGPSVDPDVLKWMIHFGERELGKGVVICKDTPNFVANRIAALQANIDLESALAGGYAVEEVDAILGPITCRPATAVFRLRDLVGLDVSDRVWENLYLAIPDDPFRDLLIAPRAYSIRKEMIARGRLGRKTGQGFYKQVRTEAGKEFWALDLGTLEYRRPSPSVLETVEQAKRIEDPGERMRFLVAREDRVGALVWTSISRGLAYAAYCLPEIADSPTSIDRAMRWGYGWVLGPFEIWDALGVEQIVDRLRAEKVPVAGWVTAMLERGCPSFYVRDGERLMCYDLESGGYISAS